MCIACFNNIIPFFELFINNALVETKLFANKTRITRVDRRNVFQRLFKPNDPFLTLRFFAAFVVFIEHMHLVFNVNTEIFLGGWEVIGGWLLLVGSAHQGMAIFFTLSGFLMGKAFLVGTYQYSADGIIQFYKNRFFRIFPLMAFVLFFEILLQYPTVFRNEPMSLWRILTFTFNGQNINAPGLGAMWSLSTEMQYYLICPFLFSLFSRRILINKNSGILMLVLTILLAGIIKSAINNYLFNDNYSYIMLVSLLGNLPFFLTGLLANFITINLPEVFAKIYINFFTQILCFFFFYYFLIFHRNTNLTSLITFFSIVFIESISRHRAIIEVRSFSIFGLFQTLGVLSYGFYLWHPGLGFIDSKLFSFPFINHESYVFEITYVAVITLITSLVTYLLVEDRFYSFKR